MLHAVKVKPDVYWVGGIDWNERNFHGYTTDRGSTYNAYLIMDEQVTLIDTCKPAFAGELIERISEVVDPACIEHVIVNHVEQDHSGAVPAISYLAPRAKIYASGPCLLRRFCYTVPRSTATAFHGRLPRSNAGCSDCEGRASAPLGQYGRLCS